MSNGHLYNPPWLGTPMIMLAVIYGHLVHKSLRMRSNTFWPILCLIKCLRDGHYTQVSLTHYAPEIRMTKKSSPGKAPVCLRLII